SIPAIVTSGSKAASLRVANGEFVEPGPAVRFYGLPYMEAIRNLQLPKPKSVSAGGAPIISDPLVKLGPDDFILPATSVGYYGVGFLEAVRALQAPKILVKGDPAKILEKHRR